MSNFTWLLDAGHGGMHEDHYTTAPSKMFTFPDGLVIYEGVINRKITDILIGLMEENGIRYKKVYHDAHDYSLPFRVSIADAVYQKDKSCIYLSIHSNSGGGSGFEIFTSPGQSKSDKVANIFCEVYQSSFPDIKFRSDKSDGDADKEENFYVLRKTDCPALLVENLFFDNRREAEILLSEVGQKKIAKCLFDCIMKTEQLKPI
jgi:N-acetylmuramoyl-L-alanine amidase